MLRHGLIGLAALIAGLATDALASMVQMEFQLKSGPCSPNILRSGTLDVHGNDLKAMLKLLDGETVNFSTPISKNGTFKARFQIKSGDGFEIEGRFDGVAGQGTWTSPTLSCNGDWKAG
jgi:hypothetical protein